ncbi:hypothetical protein PAHAL_3G061100 [Panicum hallii]|uniref:Jacalin-type lectin domain-containing protein n=1 Tax=Panicum hallii TaxID=206008 RepID=A0A2T8KHA9_9POAL|nr:hypothetical protein PAHAL_3G061100 [Panicum hallii]
MQIKLAPVEYVRRLSGTIGQAFGSEARMLVASLQIRTNISDDQFSIPLPENVSVVGFGRAGNLLDAIGVYIAYKSPNFPIAHHATEETSGYKDEETSKNTTATTSQPPLTIITGQTAETLPIKVGPWGGSRGDPFGITKEPKRLESVTARVGAFVSSFGFSYVDLAGLKHTVGPAGGNAGKLITIQFEPTEYVKEFSGSVGLTQGACVVTYLRIETNLKAYELYDEGTDLFPSLPGFGVPMPEKEVPFSIPVPENTSIVGFFGRAGGDHLDAIGVYVKATNTSTAQETGSYLDDYSPDEPINLHGCRAWGGDGHGGTEFDVTEPPKRLESMTVRAGNSVDSIGFSYADEEGQKHGVGPFGGTGGQLTTIEFAPAEYVKKLSGTIGRSSTSGGMSFVASLEIETNIRTYGPYGKAHNDYPFSIPLPEDFSIVGFFGRAGRLPDAVGVYIGYSRSPFTDATEETSSDKDGETSKDEATASPESQTITDEQTFPIKIVMWGSGEGMEFDVAEPPKRLDGVMIRAGDIIDSFGFSYTDRAGKKHTVGPYGGSGGSLTSIQLEPTEYVKHFSGTTGTYVGSPAVASQKIETNLRVIPLPKNASVVGFFGVTDNLLGAIGVYVGGSIPN